MRGLGPCTRLSRVWAAMPEGSLVTHSGCQQKELESGSVASRQKTTALPMGGKTPLQFSVSPGSLLFLPFLSTWNPLKSLLSPLLRHSISNNHTDLG